MKVYLLGNGKSLWGVDLESLPVDAVVIACNRIHKHWSFVKGWRPDAWVFGDLYGNTSYKEEVILHVEGGYDCWIKSNILDKILNAEMEPRDRFWWSDYPNVRPYQNCVHRRDMNPPDGWHPPNICNFTGAANAMAQVAVWEFGATEIFWLGIDGDIKKGKTGNHMTDDYQEVWYGPPLVERINDELQIGHDLISKELEKAGIPAYNLTPKSAFNQYPREMAHAV